jgi:hypothetical protein
MIRRMILLLSIAAVGWYAITRLLRSRPASLGDDVEAWPDEQQGGFAERVTEKASGAVAVTRRAAQAPMERIRSIIGEHEGSTQEDAAEVVTDGEGAATPESPIEAVEGGGAADAAVAQTGAVKGNINRVGDKIYHLPGDPAYARTKAEHLFASAKEAEAAGYRRAGQRHND